MKRELGKMTRRRLKIDAYNYVSAEIVLVDDVLFVDNNWNGILEFTKAE